VGGTRRQPGPLKPQPLSSLPKGPADLLECPVQNELAENPPFRTLLIDLKRQFEQIIDEVSADQHLSAGSSEETKKKARALTKSFEQFIRDNKNEIDALQFFYSQPYSKRLRFEDIKALAEAIKTPPRSWTPELLWRAYEMLSLDLDTGQGLARFLRLEGSYGPTIEEEEVVSLAVSRSHEELADGNPSSGTQVDLVPVLNDPPSFEELGVDLLPGDGFGAGHRLILTLAT